MAKIMQNGKCYGSDNSKDIRYDNTNRNMEATNVQSAIDELNSNIESKNLQYRLMMVNDITLSNNDITTIPLTSYWRSAEDILTVNSDGNVVYNGDMPAYVMISASLYFYTGDEKTRKTISIYRNDNIISTANILPGSDYIMLNAPTVVHNLFKGDVLRLAITGVEGDLIKSYATSSQMSIMGYTSEYLANKS